MIAEDICRYSSAFCVDVAVLNIKLKCSYRQRAGTRAAKGDLLHIQYTTRWLNSMKRTTDVTTDVIRWKENA
jgi:hypothetical protein